MSAKGGKRMCWRKSPAGSRITLTDASACNVEPTGLPKTYQLPSSRLPYTSLLKRTVNWSCEKHHPPKR